MKTAKIVLFSASLMFALTGYALGISSTGTDTVQVQNNTTATSLSFGSSQTGYAPFVGNQARVSITDSELTKGVNFYVKDSNSQDVAHVYYKYYQPAQTDMSKKYLLCWESETVANGTAIFQLALENKEHGCP